MTNRCTRCGHKHRKLYPKGKALNPAFDHYWEYSEGEFCKHCLTTITENALSLWMKDGAPK